LTAWKDSFPKWPIMCRVGCWTRHTYSLTQRHFKSTRDPNSTPRLTSVWTSWYKATLLALALYKGKESREECTDSQTSLSATSKCSHSHYFKI